MGLCGDNGVPANWELQWYLIVECSKDDSSASNKAYPLVKIMLSFLIFDSGGICWSEPAYSDVTLGQSLGLR